jgi:anti-anti-sigma factor
MEMRIIERDDDITHIALSGRLDATSIEEFDERFLEVAAENKQAVVIDLSLIEFIASRGIAALVTKSRNLRKDGLKMVLLNPQEMVNAVFLTSRLDKIIPIAYEFDEAMRILGRAPGKHATTSPGLKDEALTTPTDIPTAAAGVLRMAIKNQLSGLETVTQQLHEFLDAHSVPSKAAYTVDLAIEELVVNVINYAFVDDDEHLIDVELAVRGDELILQIEDDGRPFDPREGPELNPHAEDREVGGLGLILVLDMVDALRYERAQERNRVEVRVHLAADEDSELTEAAEDTL